MRNATEKRLPGRLCDVAHPLYAAPDSIALSGLGEAVTYGVLNERIDAARGAYAKLGLAPLDRIVLLLPTSLEFVIAYFGAHRAGLVVIPLNPLLGPDEVGFVLATMRPALVVAGEPTAPYPVLQSLDALTTAVSPTAKLVRFGRDGSFELLMKDAPAHLPPVQRAAEEEALILFTSGTSGRPKGASHAEASLIDNVQHSNSVLGFDSHDLILCPLPLPHVFGQVVVLLGGLMAGAEVLLVPRPRPDVVFDVLTVRLPTFIGSVPTTFAALAESGRRMPGRAQAVSRRLRAAFSGGAPLLSATAEDFESVFGVPVHQGYGMTEAGGCIAVEDRSVRPTGGVGQICLPVRHRIVPIEEAVANEGELELSGRNLFRGYYVDGTLQVREPDEWFATGDVARVDCDGNLFLLDRKKEMIIRNGYNVYPSEVEAALTSHPDVVLAAVIAVPDLRVGQEIAAFVSLREGAELTPEAVAAWCRERIALYKYPRLIGILPAMPTNPTGKILKRSLDPSSLRRVDVSEGPNTPTSVMGAT